jgi:hypothetical protein
VPRHSPSTVAKHDRRKRKAARVEQRERVWVDGYERAQASALGVDGYRLPGRRKEAA